MKKKSVNRFNKSNRVVNQKLSIEKPRKIAARIKLALFITGVINKNDSRKYNLKLIKTLVRKYYAKCFETCQPKEALRLIVEEVAFDNGKNERCAAYAVKSALGLRF